MKKYILLVFILSTAYITNAQQLQNSSFYDMQGIINNPSMAGVFQKPEVKGTAGATYRSQWSGISGSPETITVFGSFALPKQKIGIGGYVYNDKTGPTSRTGIQLALAKHILMNNGANFSLGIETKLQQYSINKSKLSESLASDPVLGASDNRMKFDAGFGISYTTEKFQLGASVTQLVQSKLDFYSGNLQRSEVARLYRHYYAHGSYNWDVDGATTITPNFLVTYLPNAPTEFQGGVRVEHNQAFFWGLALRARQSWMLTAGLHIHKKLTIGYTYDVYKTPISLFDNGSNAHEVLLKYNFLK
ncbi:PorP/SprF family type IX secretion system membrane protein [Ferruginibacter sp. HRS2-29]|uniref:PorP/SprF family type IX secretion system membrane protein n=1 Tax=Ferruginibacter sp. HRS2-29 TaxID=2487334 RepID=UPI0020CE9B30|nr:PorP/SprF family type IX secretion system membrane protein [Ferruginibacter sp. HRS2-29]MCP9750791.1 type IX secretion system membrane protein PorP/SprF [Ferruginibacter sp. HRS2-29]